jgi:hypothetical protein
MADKTNAELKFIETTHLSKNYGKASTLAITVLLKFENPTMISEGLLIEGKEFKDRD